MKLPKGTNLEFFTEHSPLQIHLVACLYADFPSWAGVEARSVHIQRVVDGLQLNPHSNYLETELKERLVRDAQLAYQDAVESSPQMTPDRHQLAAILAKAEAEFPDGASNQQLADFILLEMPKTTDVMDKGAFQTAMSALHQYSGQIMAIHDENSGKSMSQHAVVYLFRYYMREVEKLRREGVMNGT